jgi:hypothetical protein
MHYAAENGKRRLKSSPGTSQLQDVFVELSEVYTHLKLGCCVNTSENRAFIFGKKVMMPKL